MRILFIILLPVILYPIILIYFNKYQDILIKSEFAAIERQGLTLTKALALAENQYGLIQNNQISSPALQGLIPKVEYGSNIRARLFNMYGNLIADTKVSMKYSPFVKVSPLPAVDNRFSIKNVLITRGDDGLSYVGKKENIHQPTKKIEVFDVSGAGDTVLAILSVCVPNKIQIKKSLELANKAAGIVVGKIGTSTVSLKELFKEEQLFINKKCSLLELKKIVADYKRKKYKVGFTNGCFDILHKGHINYLEESKKLCDKLIVAINSDSSVKKIKGKNRPINNQEDRAEILSALSFCDHVIIFNQLTPIQLITSLKPDIITKGGDYKKKNVVGYNEIKKWQGQVHIINYTEGKSTTGILKKLI